MYNMAKFSAAFVNVWYGRFKLPFNLFQH